jgi:thiol-disulfide isomerase/thioredoxin
MTEPSWSSTGLEVLHDTDFSGTHLNRTGVYVVCFGATWCPVTRRFMPKFVAGQGKFGGTVAIADITDLESPLWETFRIRITPSILVFREGEVVRRVDGRRFLGIRSAALAELETPPSPSGPG